MQFGPEVAAAAHGVLEFGGRIMRAGSPLHFGVSSSVHGEERMMHMLYLLTGRPCLPRWDAALLQRDRWPRSHFEPSELSREQPSHFPSGAGLLV